MKQSDSEYHGSEQTFLPVGAGCPFLPLNTPENHLHPQGSRPTEQSWAPTRKWADQTSTFLPYLETRQVQALPLGQTERRQVVSQHVRSQDSQRMDCLPQATCHHTVPPGWGLCGVSPARGWAWLASLLYAQRRVPTYARLCGSLSLCRVDPCPEGTQGNRQEAQTGAAEVAMATIAGAFCVHSSASSPLQLVLPYCSVSFPKSHRGLWSPERKGQCCLFTVVQFCLMRIR